MERFLETVDRYGRVMEAEAEQKYLNLLEQQIAEGSYRPDWASLAGAPVPDWFLREKLGIFLHWGLYSVPACTNEWYSRNMYIKGMPAYEHHRKTYGEQREFGYKDFIPLFRAERFDPASWWRSTMTGSRCMRANFRIGTRRRWDQREIFSGN